MHHCRLDRGRCLGPVGAECKYCADTAALKCAWFVSLVALPYYGIAVFLWHRYDWQPKPNSYCPRWVSQISCKAHLQGCQPVECGWWGVNVGGGEEEQGKWGEGGRGMARDGAEGARYGQQSSTRPDLEPPCRAFWSYTEVLKSMATKGLPHNWITHCRIITLTWEGETLVIALKIPWQPLWCCDSPGAVDSIGLGCEVFKVLIISSWGGGAGRKACLNSFSNLLWHSPRIYSFSPIKES